MTTLAQAKISLAVGCEEECREFASGLLSQLVGGQYGRCSVFQIPETHREWSEAHTTARKRARRCRKRGYEFAEIRREQYEDDIFAINTSLDHRQGRPMAAPYWLRPSYKPLPEDQCLEHHVATYGVLHELQLVAYLWLYRCGDLALISSILGHGRHLENEVMYLLMDGVIMSEAGSGGFLVYNRHDSGTDGLRFYKQRCGFTETEVLWLP